MDTTIIIIALSLFAAGVVKFLVNLPWLLRLVSHAIWCWWNGFVRVNARQEKTASRLAFYVSDEDCLDLDAVSELVEDDVGATERRVRRARKAPFASWLVSHIRGVHLSQCPRTDASVMVFERHARAIMAEHGVRPSDAAAVLPYATALFFEHRSFDQIEAAAITNAASFVNSRREFSANYVGVAGWFSFGGTT